MAFLETEVGYRNVVEDEVFNDLTLCYCSSSGLSEADSGDRYVAKITLSLTVVLCSEHVDFPCI